MSNETPAPPPTPEPDEVVDAEIVPDPTPTTGTPALTGTPTFAPTGYTDAGVPTLDYLQERIEARIGLAEGTAVINDSAAIAEALEKKRADQAAAAVDRLAEIRRSLGT